MLIATISMTSVVWCVGCREVLVLRCAAAGMTTMSYLLRDAEVAVIQSVSSS